LEAAGKDEPKPYTLTPQEIDDGWLLLFDGDTTFGWKIDGVAKVKDGMLVLGGDKETAAAFTTEFGYGVIRFEAFTDDAKDAKLTFNAYKKRAFIHAARPCKKGWHHFQAQADPAEISIWTD